MSWSHNVFRFAFAGLTSVLLYSNVANAQAPAQSPTAQMQQVGVRNAGESISDYIGRVAASNSESVAGAIADILRTTPTDLSEIIKFALGSGESAVAADVVRGTVLAAAGNPVAVTEQTSAFALANPANVAQVINLARQANNNPFSEVLGEGLALAASTLRSQNTGSGNANAIAIQTQATGQSAPLALSEAFMDNYILTAAGAAGPGAGGPAGGGDVSNNAGTFNAGTGTLGAGGGGVTQAGGARSGISSAGFSFATTSPSTVNNFTTLPVPGPEAGAGLGTLAVGALAYWIKRRKFKAS